MQALPGVLEESEPLRRTIVDVLWKGLCRHAVVSGTALPTQCTHADAWLAAHQEKFFGETQQQESPASVVHHLMKYCRNGEYGGMVLEEGHPTSLAPYEAAAAFQLNRATPVVAMNEAAMKLRDIGNGVDPRLVKTRRRLAYRHARDAKSTEAKAAAEDSSVPSTEARPDPSTPREQQVEPKESQHHERLPRDADKKEEPPSPATPTTEHDSPRSTTAVNSSAPRAVQDPKVSQNSQLLQRDGTSALMPTTAQDGPRSTPPSSVAAAEISWTPSTVQVPEMSKDHKLLERDAERKHDPPLTLSATKRDVPRRTTSSSLAAVNSSAASTVQNPKMSKNRKLFQKDAYEEVDRSPTMHHGSRGTPSSSVAAENSPSPSTEPHADQHTHANQCTIEKLKRLRDMWERQDKKQGVIRVPWYQRELRCMECAGFVQSGKSHLFSGAFYHRVVRWKEDDIRAFYSRAAEAFGVSLQYRSYARYLFKDSLARTMSTKFQLWSRAKAYRRLGSNLGGWPVLNENRPYRFRNHQPIPFEIECTNRSSWACCRWPTITEEE